MANLKTPGVYIEEVSVLPSSVAGVPTAIPGFVGYTQQAILPDGSSASNKPVKITSMLEYQSIFGGAHAEDFTVTLSDGVSSPNISIGFDTPQSQFILFYQMQMFYANGGGTCYVVSVGNYSGGVSQSALESNIALLEQIDEITLLCVPEAVFGNDADQLDINTAMLEQAARLQDRFALMDVVHKSGNTILQDAQNFRDNNTTADNLKFGAAYYPALKSTINVYYENNLVEVEDNRTVPVYVSPYNTLNFIADGSITPAVASTGSIEIVDNTLIAAATTINFYGVTITEGANFDSSGSEADTAESLLQAIKSMVPGVIATRTGAIINLKASVPGIAGDDAITIVPSNTSAIDPIDLQGGAAPIVNVAADKQLYNAIQTELAKFMLDLYPSAAMAGIYARVDGERGVWKAPANVGLAKVTAPAIDITDESQENLNVDSTSGKSINAVRKFTGRGNLVWGARTLAGNDNEWRYVNVRRLFLYVEESCKKASEFMVFESNTANTWLKVQGMIEAFLTDLWRSGGLAGSVPKDAFYVKVGLGTTMTAQDILEGRMIVEIGMAAARPAEFIVLKFMHKLQES